MTFEKVALGFGMIWFLLLTITIVFRQEHTKSLEFQREVNVGWMRVSNFGICTSATSDIAKCERFLKDQK